MQEPWGKPDRDYFRAIGIDLDDPEPEVKVERPPTPYLVIAAWAFLALLSGFLWYGLLLLGAWSLRACGVNITGI